MATRLYAGNLPYDTSDHDLRAVFSRHGEVRDVRLISDRDTGRSKGFAFVEMADEEGARRAIEELDQTDFGGRRMVVNQAREREPQARDHQRGRHGW